MEAGLNASLELQCRKTMEIRTKHVRAGFGAGLEGLKAMEIGAKQYDKEGFFFGPQNIRKSRRAKMGLSSSPAATTQVLHPVTVHVLVKSSRV